jgi:hypothetical protein
MEKGSDGAATQAGSEGNHPLLAVSKVWPAIESLCASTQHCCATAVPVTTV